MVFGTTSAEVLDRNLQVNTHHAAMKQIIYACFSIALAMIVWFYGYQKILKWTPILFYLLLGCLIAVFIPGIGQQINGAYRWIALGPFSFQPSELMKLMMPLMFIHLFFKKEEKMSWKTFYKIIALFCVPLFLILIEPDNGTVAILLMTMMALFFLCRIRWLYWLLPVLVLGSVGVFCALQMTHVQHRLRVYMNPELDLLGKGHQPYQAKIAAGSGGITGKGVGESVQKLNYLPTARSDYIAAIYAEEFGFLGILFLVLLYMVIAYSGFRNASLAGEKQGYIVAAIMTFLVSLQAFLNLGVVSGLLPSKGTNLPFFSQGGSSLIANTIALTLIVNVARKPKREMEKQLSCKKVVSYSKL
jgi:cell division protein FtsW